MDRVHVCDSNLFNMVNQTIKSIVYLWLNNVKSFLILLLTKWVDHIEQTHPPLTSSVLTFMHDSFVAFLQATTPHVTSPWGTRFLKKSNSIVLWTLPSRCFCPTFSSNLIQESTHPLSFYLWSLFTLKI